jgi:hypothetical protein
VKFIVTLTESNYYDVEIEAADILDAKRKAQENDTILHDREPDYSTLDVTNIEKVNDHASL